MSHIIKVNWTGAYPNLCSGNWEISINGVELKGLGSEDFGTFGTYEECHFDANYNEEFNDYDAGEMFGEWVQHLLLNDKNDLMKATILADIKFTLELFKELFSEIQSADWRSGSCGGCI